MGRSCGHPRRASMPSSAGTEFQDGVMSRGVVDERSTCCSLPGARVEEPWRDRYRDETGAVSAAVGAGRRSGWLCWSVTPRVASRRVHGWRAGSGSAAWSRRRRGWASRRCWVTLTCERPLLVCWCCGRAGISWSGGSVGVWARALSRGCCGTASGLAGCWTAGGACPGGLSGPGGVRVPRAAMPRSGSCMRCTGWWCGWGSGGRWCWWSTTRTGRTCRPFASSPICSRGSPTCRSVS